MEATETKTQIFVRNVFSDERYRKFRDEVISNPSMFLKDYGLIKHTPMTFVRISSQLVPRRIRHSKYVHEVITNCREDLLGHNVICAYFEEGDDSNFDLLKDIHLRMRSRFGDAGVIFRQVYEFSLVEY